MFTSLRLERFKSFKDAELKLGPFTVLIGANASGKSNIRDAFRFLHGIGRGYSLAEIIGEKYGEGGERVWTGIRGGSRRLLSRRALVRLDVAEPLRTLVRASDRRNLTVRSESYRLSDRSRNRPKRCRFPLVAKEQTPGRADRASSCVGTAKKDELDIRLFSSDGTWYDLSGSCPCRPPVHLSRISIELEDWRFGSHRSGQHESHRNSDQDL